MRFRYKLFVNTVCGGQLVMCLPIKKLCKQTYVNRRTHHNHRKLTTAVEVERRSMSITARTAAPKSCVQMTDV